MKNITKISRTDNENCKMIRVYVIDEEFVNKFKLKIASGK